MDMIWRRLAIEIFIVVAIGAALGLLGPFDTYAMPVALRIGWWIAFILAGYAIFRPVQTVALWLAEETAIPRWAALLLAGALASLPLTALIGLAIGGMRRDSLYLGAGFPILYLQVAGIGFAILLIMRFLFLRQPEEDDADSVSAPRPLDLDEIGQPERPAAVFFDRLPRALGDNLVCLEMQDHYVKAHTLAGSEMVLMRLRDAITELGGVEGMQVHRSWWVARNQVRGVKRDGRALSLELGNGIVVPVARARQADLKRAGWL